MDGPSDAQKADGNSQNVLQTGRKLTEGPQMHGKLAEGPVIARKVDERSRNRMKG